MADVTVPHLVMLSDVRDTRAAMDRRDYLADPPPGNRPMRPESRRCRWRSPAQGPQGCAKGDTGAQGAQGVPARRDRRATRARRDAAGTGLQTLRATGPQGKQRRRPALRVQVRLATLAGWSGASNTGAALPTSGTATSSRSTWGVLSDPGRWHYDPEHRPRGPLPPIWWD